MKIKCALSISVEIHWYLKRHQTSIESLRKIMTTMVTLTITKFLRCLFREKSDKKIIFPFVLYLLETVKSFEDSLSAMQRMQRQLSYQNACACVCTHPWTRGQSRRDASKIVLSLLSLSLSLPSFYMSRATLVPLSSLHVVLALGHPWLLRQ